jgi:ABC-type lipopolysaccharide export system ATPase subunit
MYELEADSIVLDFGQRNILKDVFLRCNSNEVLGLLGRNGQGKSCLLQIIYGVLEPGYKLVRINKQVMRTACTRPDMIRYLPQFNFLPPDISIQQALYLFEAQFQALETWFPETGWRLSGKVGELSGGQRRILEVYLIIQSKTKFVLLDEPFTHLMPIQVDKVKQLIQSEKQHKGFIVTDHLYRDILDISDRMYLINNGKTHPITDKEQLRDLGYIR